MTAANHQRVRGGSLPRRPGALHEQPAPVAADDDRRIEPPAGAFETPAELGLVIATPRSLAPPCPATVPGATPRDGVLVTGTSPELPAIGAASPEAGSSPAPAPALASPPVLAISQASRTASKARSEGMIRPLLPSIAAAPVFFMICSIWAGASLGLHCSISAATPAATGLACEVPE